tara:strand:+ start:1530 stop:1763 length:234 start_codon:yes stop_codon:yes gene_type:complete
MTVEELNKYVNEESVRGELTRELLGVHSDYTNGKINAKVRDELLLSIENGFHAEDAHANEQTAKFIRSAVYALMQVV